MLRIQVLGPGCPSCIQLASNAEAAARELGKEYELAKVTDINEIFSLGVMITPALVVDGRIVSAGSVPDVEQVKKYMA